MIRQTVIATFTLSLIYTFANDWTQWRGPNRDGVVTGKIWPNNLKAAHLAPKWRVELGSSYSGPIMNGDTVYVHIDSVDGEPLTATGLFVPVGDLAEAALEAGVPELTWNWDVWSTDGFEVTPSMSGVRTMHIDVSDMLGIDVASLPTVFALHNNYPNPFNPITNINYDIPEVSEVTLEIYNVMGQRVRTLVQGTHEPGRYQIVWNATNDLGQGLSSGMYVYRIQAGDFVSVKKLVLMK